MLTLTHTYPLETRFVNPEEWESPGKIIFSVGYLSVFNSSSEFKVAHHLHWGKLYAADEVTVSASPSCSVWLPYS